MLRNNEQKLHQAMLWVHNIAIRNILSLIVAIYRPLMPYDSWSFCGLAPGPSQYGFAPGSYQGALGTTQTPPLKMHFAPWLSRDLFTFFPIS